MIERLYRTYVRAPDHPFKMRIERWLAAVCLPATGGTFDVDGGITLQLHPRDWIEYVLIREGRYEPLTLRFIQVNLRAGQSALLAGINFGLHVVVASRTVGASGRVVGVDPQVGALVRTRAHLALNGTPPNVRLVPAALGRQPGLVVLNDPPIDNSGNANLRTSGAGPVCVHSAPVSELWRLLHPDLPSPDLMLLDVEGFEAEVLAGFDARFRPGLIVIELRDDFLRQMGSSVDQVGAQLNGLGYTLHALDGSHVAPGDPLPEHNAIAVLRNREPVRFLDPAEVAADWPR
jgi:FkbM family methyltransferase